MRFRLLVRRQFLRRLGDVGLVLEQDVQGLLGLFRVDVFDAEQHEGSRPVEGLADRRRLLELELADGPHDAGHLVGQGLGDARHLGEHDLLLAREVGV
ncbi:MAG: hypothetical protein ACK559_29420, partial [bacterium]